MLYVFMLLYSWILTNIQSMFYPPNTKTNISHSTIGSAIFLITCQYINNSILKSRNDEVRLNHLPQKSVFCKSTHAYTAQGHCPYMTDYLGTLEWTGLTAFLFRNLFMLKVKYKHNSCLYELLLYII